MNRIIPLLFLLVFASIGLAEEATRKAPKTESFKAGGTPIFIPAPTSDMVEAGYDNREMMEIVVPATNRLLALFMLPEEIPAWLEGKDGFALSHYAMVQVQRRAEHMDCGTNEFKQVTKSVEEKFGSMVGSTWQEVEDDFNSRMKALDLENLTMSLGEPIQLGCFFSKQDAYSFGMILPVSIGNETTKMGMSVSFIRANDRLLFLYLYSKYENEETVTWLRRNTEFWVDAILEANE